MAEAAKKKTSKPKTGPSVSELIVKTVAPSKEWSRVSAAKKAAKKAPAKKAAKSKVKEAAPKKK